MMASIEEKVEEHFKKELQKLKIRHYGKTESINPFLSSKHCSEDKIHMIMGLLSPVFEKQTLLEAG